MFDSKSDYALNKRDSDAIVCRSATGEHIRLTREDFASDEEFLRWKEWSDREYHDSEKAGRGYYDNCIPLFDALDVAALSAEDLLMSAILEAERIEYRTSLLEQVFARLTRTQYRRLWMFNVTHLDGKQIAQMEGVTQQAISLSLLAAQKKLRDIFSKK